MPELHRITNDPSSRSKALQAALYASEGDVVVFERKFTVANDNVRERVIQFVQMLKPSWIMRIRKKNRTREQNDKMWAMLTDLSVAKPEGRECTPDDWKCLVMHACGHDVQFMIGLDGKPFPVGFRSSHLNIGQMSTLIEWMLAYGADHGVQWSEQETESAGAQGVRQVA